VQHLCGQLFENDDAVGEEHRLRHVAMFNIG